MHVAASVQEALEIVRNKDIVFALLDVNLGTETSEAIAIELQKLATPFVFATGYGDMSALKDQFPKARFLTKPYDKNLAVKAITDL